MSPMPRGTDLPSSCCESMAIRHLRYQSLVVTDTHSGRPSRKPSHPLLTPSKSPHCWPECPPTEARHRRTRPSMQLPSGHRLSSLPKTRRESTRPGATESSSMMVAGRSFPSVSYCKSRQIRTHIAIYCDRGRNIPTRPVHRIGTCSPGSYAAGRNIALGNWLTGGRLSGSLSISMRSGASSRGWG